MAVSMNSGFMRSDFMISDAALPMRMEELEQLEQTQKFAELLGGIGNSADKSVSDTSATQTADTVEVSATEFKADESDVKVTVVIPKSELKKLAQAVVRGEVRLDELPEELVSDVLLMAVAMMMLGVPEQDITALQEDYTATVTKVESDTMSQFVELVMAESLNGESAVGVQMPTATFEIPEELKAEVQAVINKIVNAQEEFSDNTEIKVQTADTDEVVTVVTETVDATLQAEADVTAQEVTETDNSTQTDSKTDADKIRENVAIEVNVETDIKTDVKAEPDHRTDVKAKTDPNTDVRTEAHADTEVIAEDENVAMSAVITSDVSEGNVPNGNAQSDVAQQGNVISEQLATTATSSNTVTDEFMAVSTQSDVTVQDDPKVANTAKTLAATDQFTFNEELEQLRQIVSQVTVKRSDPQQAIQQSYTVQTYGADDQARGRLVSKSDELAMLKNAVKPAEVNISAAAETKVTPVVADTETSVEVNVGTGSDNGAHAQTDVNAQNAAMMNASQPTFPETPVVFTRVDGTEITVKRDEVIRQVVTNVVEQTQTADGDTEYTLTLEPQDLGSITVRMTKTADGTFSVSITAENARTQRIIEENGLALQNSLKQNGIELESWQTVNESEQQERAEDYNGSSKNPYYQEEQNENDDAEDTSFAEMISTM